MNENVEFEDILKHPANRNVHENKKKPTLERFMSFEFHNSFGFWIGYELLDISLRYKKNLLEKRFTPELYQKMLDAKINEFLSDDVRVRELAEDMGMIAMEEEDFDRTARELRAFAYRIADSFVISYIDFYSPKSYEELIEVTNKASLEINRIILEYKRRVWEVWMSSGDEKMALDEGAKLLDDDCKSEKLSEAEADAMKELLYDEFEKVKKFYVDNRLHVKNFVKVEE